MADREGFGSWGHLAQRFFGAISPAGPSPADEAWALSALLPGEQALWHRMSGPDRRHAVGVARDTVRALGAEHAPREVVAAALLHDVGKVEAGLGTFARVGVTLAAMAAGRRRLLEWSGPPPGTGAGARTDAASAPSLRSRLGLYLAHDQVGAQLLEAAGSQPFTSTWAREHHLPPERWTVGLAEGTALKKADGD